MAVPAETLLRKKQGARRMNKNSLWQTFYYNLAIVGVFHQQLLQLNILEIY